MNGSPPSFSALEIVEVTGGTILRGNDRWRCRGISTDSRTMENRNLFVALQGENFDGSDYIHGAAERGAAGVLIPMDRKNKLQSLPEDFPAIGVTDTIQAYGALAGRWRSGFTTPIIAITGSSGKTTTKEMVAAIASRTMKIIKTEGNFNNQVGLPFTLLKLQKEHQLAVLEMGTNSPGEIAKLAAIAKPDIALITNVGPAHLEGLGSIEEVAAEKSSLWRTMNGKGTAVINMDDPALTSYISAWWGNSVSFGLSGAADVTARNISSPGWQGIDFDLVIDGIPEHVFLAAYGMHNIKNALAAAAAAWAAGFTVQEIAAGLASFTPLPGRTEIREIAGGAHLIVDTYNANPYSVTEALKILQELNKQGKAVAILGDMLELGKDAEKWHKEIGKMVAAGKIDFLFLKGKLTRMIAETAIENGYSRDKIIFFDNSDDVVYHPEAMLKKGDWALIKGSRKMKMETVAEGIVKAASGRFNRP